MVTVGQRAIGALLRRFQRQQNLKARFSAVYANNLWEDDESRSGPGSRRDSACVKDTIDVLTAAVATRGVRSINDIPCGDFNWIEPFLRSNREVAYRGFDIVEALIAQNRKTHRDFHFASLDITVEVPPRSDLVLCKDLLNHLDYADVRKALANIVASGAQWLLASNNFDVDNIELWPKRFGASRHLDITRPPLSYPPPVWHDHYLGLWDLEAFRSPKGSLLAVAEFVDAQ